VPKEDTQFKPGQSGNPAGKPVGAGGLTRVLKRLLKDNNGEITEKMAMQAIEHAMQGDFRYFKEIIDRTDGKVPDAMHHTGELKVSMQRIVKDEPPEGWNPLDGDGDA
jgi:hypothetical protein